MVLLNFALNSSHLLPLLQRQSVEKGLGLGTFPLLISLSMASGVGG